jgi:hypothetical protein
MANFFPARRPMVPPTLALVLLLALVLFAVTPVRAADADGLAPPPDPRLLADIERVFTEARSALAAGNGIAVLPLLSRDSRSRLEAIRTAARAGAAAGLTRFSPAEKIAVLSLQRFLTPAELRRWTTPDLINHALAAHWLSPATIAESSLGKLTLDGPRASAPLLLKGKPSLVSATFVRDGGQWRIDLGRTVGVADSLLRAFAAIAGRSEDAYVTELVGRLHPPAR